MPLQKTLGQVVFSKILNNAGVGYNALFADSNPEDWKKQIDANLYGVLHCTHAAIPLMRSSEAPMISTVSSVGGRYGIPGWAVYDATKFAVNGFHDTLRKELGGEGFRVSLIEPGAVYTLGLQRFRAGDEGNA